MPLLFQIAYIIGLVLLSVLLTYYCFAVVWKYGRRYYYRHQVVAQPTLRYHVEYITYKYYFFTNFHRSQELNQDTCAICLEQFQENCEVKKLPCHHIFHPGCVDPWLIRSVGDCPVCKRNVLTTNPRTTNNQSHNRHHENEERRSYSQNTNLLDDSLNVWYGYI